MDYEKENQELKRELRQANCDHPGWAIKSTRAKYCGIGGRNYRCL